MSYDDSTFSEADFYGTQEEVQTVTDAAPEFELGTSEVTDDTPVDDAPVADTPETTYFDPTAYANQLVKVKVDGEELDVPVAELVQGYQRQADYTRKTQELAQQREQITFWQQVDQAMRVNPQMTLDYLRQTYGITEAQANQALGVEPTYDDWDDEVPASVRKELQELRQIVQPLQQTLEQQRAQAYLDQVVTGLQSRYDDFNPNEVMQEALRRGIHDPNMLEMVYKDMAFDRVRALAAAQQTAGQQTAAANQQRAQAAQAQAAVITAGGGVKAGVTAAPRSQPRNPRDAVRMALAELGE